MKFALFGAGRIGALHAGTLAAMPEVDLKYVSDPVRVAAEGTAAAVGGGRGGAVLTTVVQYPRILLTSRRSVT